MPRPNRPRSIDGERALARRIAFERERKGMSYEGLASRMARVGCPIQASGLYKIEKAGRRITVDELLALAAVFEYEVSELLEPVEMILHEDIARVEQRERQAWDDLYEVVDRVYVSRKERAALYKRAMAEPDSDLGTAVGAYWEEWHRAHEEEMRVAAERRKTLGLSLKGAVKRIEAERAQWTEEQWAENARLVKLEESMNPLMDALHELADPENVLGDS